MLLEKGKCGGKDGKQWRNSYEMYEVYRNNIIVKMERPQIIGRSS